MENKKQNNNKTATLMLIAFCTFMLLYLVRGCQESQCHPVEEDSFNLLTGVCSRQDNWTQTFEGIKDAVPVTNIPRGEWSSYTEDWYNVEVDKSMNADGSYNITVTALMDGEILPELITFTKTKREVVFTHVKPTENCIDLIPNEDKTGLECVKGTTADEQIKDAQKKIEETKKKSELKSTEPKDICLDNYLGAVYKDGLCIFPVKERMNGRAGLEKKFGSCQINKITKGKNNTARVEAVCNGVPAIINVKNYRGR